VFGGIRPMISLGWPSMRSFLPRMAGSEFMRSRQK
jgi:hypothetical protein